VFFYLNCIYMYYSNLLVGVLIKLILFVLFCAAVCKINKFWMYGNLICSVLSRSEQILQRLRFRKWYHFPGTSSWGITYLKNAKILHWYNTIWLMALGFYRFQCFELLYDFCDFYCTVIPQFSFHCHCCCAWSGH
jgi:energy-coupling factor transporter transmembrane protein EcfT